MQEKIRKLKRNTRKRFSNFFDFVVLFMKIGVSVILVFFVILFYLGDSFHFMNQTADENNVETSSSEMSREEFIELLKPYALEAQQTHNVRPSLLIAQAALESNWGNSALSQETNNYFGIKNPKGVQYATKEYEEDEWTEVNASFKEYDSLESSVQDYASLVKNGTSWDADFYQEVNQAADYKEAAVAIQEAGYATDPNYSEKVIQIIEQYELDELDN